MGRPYASIGTPTARGEQIAAGALERLGGNARHPTRDLHRLAAAWFSPTSCFRGSVDHAAPTRQGIAMALQLIRSDREDVVQAAFAALRSAARVCRHGAYEHLPASIWELPGTITAFESSFSGSATSRLAAARFVSEFPCPALAHLLRSQLRDSIYTVRWHSAQALARLSHLDGLVAVLVASAPRDLDLKPHEPWSASSAQAYRFAAFWNAVRELGPLANDVVEKLRQQRVER